MNRRTLEGVEIDVQYNDDLTNPPSPDWKGVVDVYIHAPDGSLLGSAQRIVEEWESEDALTGDAIADAFDEAVEAVARLAKEGRPPVHYKREAEKWHRRYEELLRENELYQSRIRTLEAIVEEARATHKEAAGSAGAAPYAEAD